MEITDVRGERKTINGKIVNMETIENIVILTLDSGYKVIFESREIQKIKPIVEKWGND
jgi:hypothetical protein